MKHYKDRYGVDVDEDGVMVTTGSSAAFVLGFIAAFGPGDRVAIATPGKAQIEKKFKKYKSKRKNFLGNADLLYYSWRRQTSQRPMTCDYTASVFARV